MIFSRQHLCLCLIKGTFVPAPENPVSAFLAHRRGSQSWRRAAAWGPRPAMMHLGARHFHGSAWKPGGPCKRPSRRVWGCSRAVNCSGGRFRDGTVVSVGVAAVSWPRSLQSLQFQLLLSNHLQQPIHMSFLFGLEFLMQFPQAGSPVMMRIGRQRRPRQRLGARCVVSGALVCHLPRCRNGRVVQLQVHEHSRSSMASGGRRGYIARQRAAG